MLLNKLFYNQDFFSLQIFNNHFSNFKIFLIIIFLLILFFYIIYLIFEFRNIKGKKENIDIIYNLIKRSLSFFKNIFIISIFLFSIYFVFIVYNKINSIIEQFNFNNNLIKAIKNLSISRVICEIKVIEIDKLNEKIKIKIFYYDLNKDKIDFSEFELNGKEIFVDFIVVDFEFKFIEDGIKNNLAILNKLYTNKISPKEGIDLKNYFYYGNNIIGIQKDEYLKIIKYIDKIIEDKEFAKKEGVKTSFGSSLSFIPKSEGDIFRIYVNNTGGIILEKINF